MSVGSGFTDTKGCGTVNVCDSDQIDAAAETSASDESEIKQKEKNQAVFVTSCLRTSTSSCCSKMTD
jgi:hypothetical protein